MGASIPQQSPCKTYVPYLRRSIAVYGPQALNGWKLMAFMGGDSCRRFH